MKPCPAIDSMVTLCYVQPGPQKQWEAVIHSLFMPIKILFNFKEWIKAQSPTQQFLNWLFPHLNSNSNYSFDELYNFLLCTALVYFSMFYFENLLPLIIIVPLFVFSYYISPTNVKTPKSQISCQTSTEPDWKWAFSIFKKFKVLIRSLK